MATKKTSTVDEYINGFTGQTRQALDEIRSIIRKAVPEAGEKISYGIPTFTVNSKYLVYFAGYSHHVSIYPIPTGNAAFQEEIDAYRSGRSTARFAISEPLPAKLINDTIKHLLNENMAR